MTQKQRIPDERSAKIVGFFWVLEAIVLIVIAVAVFVAGFIG